MLNHSSTGDNEYITGSKMGLFYFPPDNIPNYSINAPPLFGVDAYSNIPLTTGGLASKQISHENIVSHFGIISQLTQQRSATTANLWPFVEEVKNESDNIMRRSLGYEDDKYKHRNIEVSSSAMKIMKKKAKAMGRRKVREPRFSFKTMSDVDVLDDGYKWRKYGQKVVKDTHHPRSYYRCTQDNCRVKKRVERLAEDPRMVITTYEGRHMHSPTPNDHDHDHVFEF